ncbi:MAG: dUTP diphosphatase [Armatimonadetes bacterium]|nr:dUTP diphosphatase [Armatimonadota bacterium]
MARVTIQVTRMEGAADLPLPAYATELSSGMDLAAAVEHVLTLLPGERALVPTGFRFEIPPGFEGQVRPRSGLALRHGISLVNTPGTIDADYRGEVKIIVINLGKEPFDIQRGDRIAQLVIAPVTQAVIEETVELSSSCRSEGGFGHTGV